jgi:predicted kinase
VETEQYVVEEIRGEIKKHLDSNKNESTAYQNLLDTVKGLFRGKFTSMNAYFKKREGLKWRLM